MVHCLKHFRLPLATAGLALAVSLAGPAGLALAQPAGEMYLCPGKLLTNRLDAAQARAQGCIPAGAGRLSQAVPAPVEQPEAAPPPGPSQPAPAAAAADAGTHAHVNAKPPAAPVAPRRTATAGTAAPLGIDAAAQRARDSDARAILQAELARTLAQQQSLAARADGHPDTRLALERLRADEAALRRELARWPG